MLHTYKVFECVRTFVKDLVCKELSFEVPYSAIALPG